MERLHRMCDVIDRTDCGLYGEGPIELVCLMGYHFFDYQLQTLRQGLFIAWYFSLLL